MCGWALKLLLRGAQQESRNIFFSRAINDYEIVKGASEMQQQKLSSQSVSQSARQKNKKRRTPSDVVGGGERERERRRRGPSKQGREIDWTCTREC